MTSFVTFAIHGNAATIAEFQYVASLPVVSAELRRAGDNSPAGVFKQKIPVLPPLEEGVEHQHVLDRSSFAFSSTFVTSDRGRITKKTIRPRVIDDLSDALATTQQFAVAYSPLFKRTDAAYAAVDMILPASPDERVSQPFPTFDDFDLIPAIPPQGYQRAPSNAHLLPGSDYCLFGCFFHGGKSTTGIARIAAEWSTRFPSLAFTVTCAYMMESDAGIAREVCNRILFYSGNGHAMDVLVSSKIPESILAPRELAMQASEGRRACNLLSSSVARRITDRYLNGTYNGATGGFLSEAPTEYFSGNLPLKTSIVMNDLHAAHYSKPAESIAEWRAALAKIPHDAVDAEAEAQRSRRDIGFSPDLAELGVYRWLKSRHFHVFDARIQASFNDGDATLMNLLLRGTPADMAAFFKKSDDVTQWRLFGPLDALLTSRDENGAFYFDSRKLAGLASCIGNDKSGVLAAVLADPLGGRLANGIDLAAYLCLADDPKLKRPALLTDAAREEELKRASRKAVSSSRTVPNSVNEKAWDAIQEYREGSPSVGFEAPSWVSSAYAGLLKLLEARQRVANKFGMPAEDTVSAISWVNRKTDSLMLMIASGHPDAARYAIGVGVPLKFVITSLVRTPADLEAFAEEFGPSIFPANTSGQGVLVLNGGMRGSSSKELERGLASVNFEGLWAQLRRAFHTRLKLHEGLLTKPSPGRAEVVLPSVARPAKNKNVF